MAGLSPAPLPVLGSLFNPTNFGCGDPAPLPVFGTLFLPTNARTLPAEAGSFALTGKAATLKAGRKLVAAQGSFTLTGEDATLDTGTVGGGMDNPAPLPVFASLFALPEWMHVLYAATGQFRVTGFPAVQAKGYVLVAECGLFTAAFPDGVCEMQMNAAAGTFAVTGEDATLTHGVPGGLVAAPGIFTLTGFPATFMYQRVVAPTLRADTGYFTFTGTAAGLDYTALPPLVGITAESGIFELSGQPAALEYTPVAQLSYYMIADAGAFTLTGGAADFVVGRCLSADCGRFALTGLAADFHTDHWTDETELVGVWTPVAPGAAVWQQGAPS